MDAQVI